MNIMEIFLDKKAVKQIRLSAQDAIDEGDMETLREDIMESFSDEQVEEIERRIDSGDFYDFLSEVLDEWSGDEIEELFELLESRFNEGGIELKYTTEDGEEDDVPIVDDDETNTEEETFIEDEGEDA